MKFYGQPPDFNDFVTFARCVSALRKKAFKLACLASLGLCPSIAVSQSETLCLPPKYPILPSDPAVMREYRVELSNEYNAFFSLAGEYINCLRQEESTVRAEIEEAISDYQKLLSLPR